MSLFCLSYNIALFSHLALSRSTFFPSLSHTHTLSLRLVIPLSLSHASLSLRLVIPLFLMHRSVSHESIPFAWLIPIEHPYTLALVEFTFSPSHTLVQLNIALWMHSECILAKFVCILRRATPTKYIIVVYLLPYFFFQFSFCLPLDFPIYFFLLHTFDFPIYFFCIH